MPHTSEARATILARIQRANRRVAGSQPEPPEHDPHKMACQSVPRAYAQTGALSPAAVLELFEQRLDDYGAHVFHANPAELQQTIGRILATRQKHRILLPAGLPAAWLPASCLFHEDNGMGAAELELYDGVMTGATVAIAATGTIVLQNTGGQGRRALSLVPDYHLCIVRTEQVVETVPQAFARLATTSRLPTTFISGPSATADIEMTRIQGVHGPRTLDVVLAK